MKKFTNIVAMLLISTCLHSQEIFLTFTSEFRCDHIAPDSIFVQNLSQCGDTVLFYPDTVLTLYITAIEEFYEFQDGFHISQNYPNPFESSTDFEVFIPKADNLGIRVYDLTGRLITKYDKTLERGLHKFTFYAGTASIYILSINSGSEFRYLKMLKTGKSENSAAEITYRGSLLQNSNIETRSLKDHFPFIPGDELSFTAYYMGFTAQITDNPVENTDYVFEIENTVPAKPQESGIVVTGTNIEWTWFSVPGSTAYHYNNENNFAESTNHGTNTSLTQMLLDCGTHYHLIVWAVNSCGVSDSLIMEAHTSDFFIFCGEDICYNGEFYSTIDIGGQCWFNENLKYDNGCSQVTWISYTDTGWCGCFNNDCETYLDEYGLLYQWSAAMKGSTVEGSQGICPPGWHIPADDEIKELEMFLGMSQEEADNTGWRGTNEGAKLAGNAPKWEDGVLINDPEFGFSGFNLLPAGRRNSVGTFQYYGRGAFLISSKQDGDDYFVRSVFYNYTNISRNKTAKYIPSPVRCLKD